MNFKIEKGTVVTTADLTRSGKILVNFGDNDSQGSFLREITYTSPFIDRNNGFFGIPNPGSLILAICLETEFQTEYFYLCSIMDISRGNLKSKEDNLTQRSFIPRDFVDAYSFSIFPQKMGFSSPRGDKFSIEYKTSVHDSIGQSYKIEMGSGSGKSIRLVDTPKVDGIIFENEHKGKCYFIWASSSRQGSAYSEGEWFLQTHGPIKKISTEGSIDLYVKDGLNIDIINESTGSKSASTDKTELDDFGCINLRASNDINVSAVGNDSVVRITAPGPNSRIIVNTEGSVDIVAKKDIKLISQEGNVIIQAPQGIIDQDATEIHLN